MLSKVLSSTLIGIDGFKIIVEVDISQGLPAFDIVGLPDSAVKESKDRVRTAIKNSDINMPVKRITINLAPANIRKEGPSFDLPIAVGILSCIEVIKEDSFKDTMIIGELSLDGSVKSVNGILPMVHTGKETGIKKFIVPYENIEEAGLVSGVDIIGVKNLNELIQHLNNKKKIESINISIDNLFKKDELNNDLDFLDVKGQENVKRALEISAAGGHNCLLIRNTRLRKNNASKKLTKHITRINF